jgi:hypothetical protein
VLSSDFRTGHISLTVLAIFKAAAVERSRLSAARSSGRPCRSIWLEGGFMQPYFNGANNRVHGEVRWVFADRIGIMKPLEHRASLSTSTALSDDCHPWLESKVELELASYAITRTESFGTRTHPKKDSIFE